MPDFEHGLDFRSLDDAVAYARRCLSAGYDRTGNWDLAQTCRHLTDWLRAPLEGPPPMPWLMRLPMAIIRLTLGPRILKQFLGNRRLPVGMGTIDATVHPPESNANAAVAAFAAMVAQFNSHTGPLMRPSPLFNRLEREQTLDLQIVHCMHHFGRPQAALGSCCGHNREPRAMTFSQPANLQELSRRRARLASRDREVTLAKWTYESRHVQKHQDAIQL